MVKMRCRKVRQTLSAYLDGALPAGKHESMTAHLETCLECRQTLNQLQELKPLLAGLSVPAMPDGLTAQVLARASERLEQRRSDRNAMAWSWFLPRWWDLETSAMRLAAAIILAIGLAAGTFFGRSTSSIPIRFALSVQVKQNQQPDTMALYGFDSLFSDTSGSIEQAYIALTFSPGHARKSAPARKEG